MKPAEAFKLIEDGKAEAMCFFAYFTGPIKRYNRKTKKTQLISSVKEPTLQIMESKSAFKNGKLIKGGITFELEKFEEFIKALKLCLQSIIVDQTLLNKLKKVRHKKKGKKSATQTSNKNGETPVACIAQMARDMGAIVCDLKPKKKMTWGRWELGGKKFSYEWDIILYFEEANVVMLLEIKVQHGGGSLEDKWPTTLWKIMQVIENYKKGSFGPPDDKCASRTRVLKKDVNVP